MKNTGICRAIIKYTYLLVFIAFFPNGLLAKGIVITANVKDVNFLNVYYNDAFYDLKSILNQEPDAGGNFVTNVDPILYPAMIACEYYGEHLFFMADEGKKYSLIRNSDAKLSVKESGSDKSADYQLLEKKSGSFRAFSYLLPKPDKLMLIFKSSNHRKLIRDSVLANFTMNAQEKEFYKTWIAYAALNDKLLPFLLQGSNNYQYSQLPSAYIDSIKKYAFMVNKDSLINNDKYRIAAFSFNKFLSRDALAKSNEFEAEFQNAETFFSGATRQMVLFGLLKDHIKNNASDFDAYYKKFSTIAEGSIYKKYMDSLYTLYKSPVSQDIASCKLYNIDNKEITFGQLLNLNKGKIVYIDFWASWCVPCKAEFYFSEKMIKEFKDQQAIFIFLSVDIEKDSWVASNKVYDFLTPENSFFVKDGFKSTMAKGYSILSIPRYLLINSDGRIIDMDAKRPSDPALNSEIKSYIK